MRVLFVEDNLDDAAFIKNMLAATMVDVEHVSRLSSALERITNDSFDVILLDLSLPDAHGSSTIDLIRTSAPNIPIVVLSGQADENVAMESIEHGAKDYLVKGQIDSQLLQHSLRYALQRHSVEERIKQRNRELLVLKRISETILGSLEPKVILDKILEETMNSGSFDLGNIRLLDTSDETLRVASFKGYLIPEHASEHRPLSKTMEEAKSRFGDRIFERACVEENVQACQGLRTLKQEGIMSMVEVPIRKDQKVLGILQLGNRARRTFERMEINLLETIGNQVGMAIDRAQLYAKTQAQARELEKTTQLQADFYAMIAHDLRSPLMNITGVAEVMLQGTFGSVTAEQEKWLSRIQDNGRTLVGLVNDFLDISKLEAGYVDVKQEKLDLAVLLDSAVESYRGLVLEKGISILKSLPSSLPVVRGDARRIEQVLSNLITNAIKFTQERGEIEIGAEETTDGWVNVWIRDNGEGIAPHEIDQIFQKYRQADNLKSTNHKGTGLGLVICKMIVEAHGGNIWVLSDPGIGSTFTFTLPTMTEDSGVYDPI